jgi:hypothetical protein
MTPRSFTVFAAVTGLMVVAAVVAVAQRPAPTHIRTNQALIYPALAKSVNDAASIAIRVPGRSFTVKRNGNGWGIAELNGYPALFDKVKTVLVQLAQLRFLEAKTSDATRYDRLAVQDVAAKDEGASGDDKDAKPKYVEVRDAKGTVLAEGHLGKRNANLFGSDKGGTYLRVGNDKQSWLAEGIVSLGDGPADWISKKIIDVKSADIKKLTILSPKGGGLVIHRAAKTDKDFTLDDIPPGKKQRGQWETDQMATALEGLELSDVRRADEIKFPDGPYKGAFTTFDGLVVKTEAGEVGKKYWARFSASAGDAGGADAAKLKKFVDEFNRRVHGFVYEIPEAVGKKLACEHRNMLEGAGENACT